MELNEKQLIEKTKSIQMANLFMKGFYIDLKIKNVWKQAYIIDIKPNNKYDLIYLHQEQIKRENDIPFSSLGIIGEHSSSAEYVTRIRCLNNDIFQMQCEEVIDLLKEKINEFNIDLKEYKLIIIEKNEDENDLYMGYNLYQFLTGIFIDCLAFIYNELDDNDNENTNDKLDELISISLDIILFELETIKNNLSLINVFLQNRKLLILDYTYAILASFHLILGNIDFIFSDDDFSEKEKISEKKSKILNICYELIINNTKNYEIPLPFLIKLIKFTTSNEITKVSINNYDPTVIFNSYLKSIQNLKEGKIKNIKKLSNLKGYSTIVVKGLYNEDKNKLIEECYFTGILICLKCNILEKKFDALNSINDIINDKNFNKYFYEFFIEKNKILEVFFEENIHDEVIKRANELFKYLAKYDKLDEDIINKLIKEEDEREVYKNIIIDILPELPLDKKNYLFNEITKKLNFDANPNDIDFLLKLVEACLKPTKTEKETKKEENKKKETKDDLYEQSYNIGINGLNVLFNYIIKDFDINKSYDKNNVDKAIESFSKIKYLKPNDILNYIEKLFDNIKNNETHNSVIQCMILIMLLINQLNEKIENIFEKLDKEYSILNLIVNDLIRYMNIIINKKEKPEQKKIYEGIYPFEKNIEERFKFFFFFVKGTNANKGLKLDSKEHLEKIYSILNNNLFENELVTFFYKFTLNIRYISKEIMNDFLTNVIGNKDMFDITNFTNNKILLFINKAFLAINTEEDILYFDTKNTRVKKEEIKNIDLLFDILINNKNSEIQNKICYLLTGLCMNLYDYKTNFCQKYWNNYIQKITNLFEKLQKEKFYQRLNGIVKLIDNIYSASCNNAGKIPRKEDTHNAKEPFELYHFSCPSKKKREYKIRVGKVDKILQMRWKLGYYYDIPINNVVFEDINKERYSFKDEEKNFFEVFPPEIYCPEDEDYILINVYSVPDLFLEIEGNPKELLEKNEIIFNNFIENLSIEVLTNDEIKQKIWNIISKFPKDIFINKNIKQFCEKEKIDENIINKLFDVKEVYILTYTLQCIKEYIKDQNTKNIFLNNFISKNKGDELLYKILLNIDTEPSNCQLINYECLSNIIYFIDLLENYKKENNISNNIVTDKNILFNKISQIILDLIRIKFNILYDNSHYNKYDIIDSVEDENINFINKQINQLLFNLIENIINFIDKITNDNSYLEYLFNNQDIFKKIFFYDYIKCEKEEMKKILKNYLARHLFKNEDGKFIKNYFEIMLSVKAFNELVNNDIDGSYFKELSLLMKKYEAKEKKEKRDIDEKHMEQIIQIIDLIINYIQNQCEIVGFFKNFDENEDNSEKEEEYFNDSKMEGILNFFKNILNLSPGKLVQYLTNKIDIFDLFLIKSILRKCNKNPLDTQKMLCISEKSQEAMFNLIIFILRNIPQENIDLQMKIWEELDNHHKIGFWKTNKISDWKLEPKEIYQNKYIGLKNMTFTCYMNSILQQFFMIPMLRETILSISNTNTDSVLYQLQLLFSALKTYEYKYYNPKSFVIKSGLSFYEQMDADEYYGQLIDKLENDIKTLYKDTESPYKDLFKFFFGIKVLDELKFVDCGHKRYNEFYYNSIQIEIKGFNNIEKSLKNYCKTEIMDGDNKINCEICNTKRTCHKRQIFKSLPNILVIALKRFEFDYDMMVKIKLNSYFEFPFELDMKEYLIEENTETNTIYELTGITIHDGVADFGHYYDLIKGKDGKWYKFNDTVVKFFNKDHIAAEAFGDKHSGDDLDKEEQSEEDNNNAYILIYTKKNFNNEKIENLENNFKTQLSLPPYTKFSNISEENKSIINNQMFRYWTLENITNSKYQEFILNLLKIDLVKNYEKNVEMNHPELFKELRDEEYLTQKENIENKKDNKIFEYGIRYFFNIMLRTSLKERAYMSKYDEIIKAYIESDSDKSQYILEEFSDNDAINEYLVFCPVEENVKYCMGIIITAFKKYYNDKNKDKTLLYNYINNLLLFMHYNIDNINLEYVLTLFNQLIHINKDKIFIKYLKEKNIEKWIEILNKDLITEEDEINIDLIMSEDNLTILKSTHYILTEKIIEKEDENNNKNRNSDKSASNEKRLKDIDINYRFVRKIGYELYKEN